MRGRKPLVAVDIALSDFGRVGVALDEKSAAALRPRLEEALALGHTVSFGAVTMTASGLGLEGKTYGWDELHSIFFFLDCPESRRTARTSTAATRRSPSTFVRRVETPARLFSARRSS